MKNFNKAVFVADMYCNFSRLANYSSLLVEEGVLPLLMHLMDSHAHDEVYRRCTETLANLSMNRKNRREIASSGIASRLNMLFSAGSPSTRSSTLLITGNLLSSGLFHDKVANHSTISNILEKLFDLNYPNQFNGVCFCLCQLSKVQSSCAVMVDCDVIPLLLNYLRKTPEESLDYMWMLLTNITSYPMFFDELVVGNGAELIQELHEEVRFDTSKLNRRKAVVKIGLNISKRPDLSSYLTQPLIDTFVSTMKTLFSSRLGTEKIQMSALVTLINFNYYCREARATTLGSDLIDLFQTVGLDDDQMNVKYAGLLNVISNEESCCYKLLDLGVHKLLVALQESFHRLTSGAAAPRKRVKSFKKGQSIKNLTNVLSSAALQNSETNALMNAGSIKIVASKTRIAPLQDPNYEYDAAIEGELGKELTAATLHNLAIKRPVVTPGLLLVILGLARNCKTLRVLHCIRSLAHMSAHPKSKVMLNKEARKILPMLTVSMRCGCEEAERVQHYCAITLCNMLAAPLEKGLLIELVNNGAIVDLVVVTLLRINSVHTKETLGRAFFNLLNRSEIREALVMKLDIVSAILELSKIEYIELLELCMHAMYNISCELKPGSGYEDGFASKLLTLKVPRFLIARLVYTPSQDGSIGTRAIRFLLGKSLVNMTFHKNLVVEFTNEQGTRLADALNRIYVLKNEESTYCACAALYNLSAIEECRVLAESSVLDMVVEVLANECPALCIKLCAASICNFSMMHVFHEKLATIAVMTTIVTLLGSPQMAMSIKKDALQTVYNMVTMYTQSRCVFVHCEGVTALWKLLKVMGGGGSSGGGGVGGGDAGSGGGEQRSLAGTEDSAGSGDRLEDEEASLVMIGHICKELTDELGVSDVNYERKMLTDGVMSIILKLAKFEMPLLKLDVSFCIYNLSRGMELMRILKADTVDILFWLTLHDTLGMHDLICKNVSRALRGFCFSLDECKVLVKQERFMPVFKSLIKSKNEDVLWQTAGVMYNLMGIEYCLKILLDRNLVNLIFEIAASGYPSVKHVCSACLHMIPEHMPNMEDPVVLELVLCLLEAEGDKFSELGNKPDDHMPYNMVNPCYAGSALKHTGTDFKALWTHQSCEVDNVFTPSLLFTPTDQNLDSSMPTQDANSFSFLSPHSKMRAADYQDFRKEADGMLSKSSFPGLDTTTGGELDSPSSTFSAPHPAGKAPPGLTESQSQSQYSTIGEDSEALDSLQEKRLQRQQQDDDLLKLHNVLTGTCMYKDGGGGGEGGAGDQTASLPQYNIKHLNQQLNTSSTRSLQSTLGRTHLPLINNPPRMPENTVGALLETINRDARQQQQQRAGGVAHLSMSSSLDSLSLTLMDQHALPGSSGGRRAQNQSRGLPDAGAGKSGTKGAHSKVIQLSVNNHGNFSR